MKYINKFFLLFVVFMPLIACDEDDAFVDKKPNVTLLSPVDKTSGVDIAPAFEWQGVDPSGDDLTYDFYLGLDSTKLYLEAKDLTETNYKLLDYKLRKDGEFYWKVVAKNGFEKGESAIWRFMSIPAPAAPSLLMPETNDFVRESLVLEWEAVPAAEGETISYNVFLDKDENPKELAGKVDDGSTSLTIDASKLDVGSVYYWRVDATDLINSSASEVRSFKKLNTGAPDEPILVTPLDKTGVPSGVVLDWTDVTDPEGDAVSYELYMDKSISPTTLVNTSNASEFTTTNLDVNSAYYWYVVAKDPAGNTTKSETFGFSVTGAGVGFPEIHDFTVQNVLSLDESLVWDAASGAASYDVYVGTSNPPKNKVASDISDTEFQIKNADIPSDLTNVKTYYALVVAKDGTGRETNSFPVSFTPQMTGTMIDVRGAKTTTYPWVRVGTQIWLTQNLRAKNLVNGDAMDRIDNGVKPGNDQLGYDQHPILDIKTHGLAYSWWCINSSSVIPEGWHVVTEAELKALRSYVGESSPVSVLGDFHGGTNLYGINFNTSGWRYNNGTTNNDFSAGFRIALEPANCINWLNTNSSNVRVFNLKGEAKVYDFGGYATNMMFGLRLIKDE
ncbi:fibronectin type III domain-containing protein [Flavicella sediminum]|uniref:fibronectin type III domain-containing protein n=1 Tax=Flavicella sediminum TaxID=2585141 RepID=UPI00111FFCFD|nr:FISUMP domain-containing protein [Flavicella sediminum]